MTREEGPVGLSDAELATVRDLARQEGHRSGPRDGSPAGCGIAFMGMVILTLTPAAGGFVDLSRFVVLSLFAVALVLLLVGAGLGMVGRSGPPGGWSRARAEDALGAILAWAESGGGRPEALRSSVVLVLSGWYADPAGAHPAYDPEAIARRLGPRGTELVRRVEETLLTAGASGDGTPAPPRPVFTDRSGASPD